MLGSIRKFSNSIYAKIFLFIVAIPFIFWGMGPVFQSGNLNTIAEVDKEKISTKRFVEFIKNSPNLNNAKLDKNSIRKILYNFIGEELITKEIEDLDIKFSDDSLVRVIKNEKLFKRNNKFVRVEYEKFLIKNQLNAAMFENNIKFQNKKEQLFKFIGGGISPSFPLVNIEYNKINQKRVIQLINLDNIFDKKLNFTDSDIKNYFNKNKEKYLDSFKSVKFLEITPKILLGNDEYDDLFFQKLDEIDDMIANGTNIDGLVSEYNLENLKKKQFNKLGNTKNKKLVEGFPKELIEKVFEIKIDEKTILFENENKYFIVELLETENEQSEVTENFVKSDILDKLQKREKRKFLGELVSKINSKDFTLIDFNKMANDENIDIKKIEFSSLNDDKTLDISLVKQVYSHPEKKIVVVADVGLRESYLVRIESVQDKKINKDSEEYKKYFMLSQAKMTSELFNTFDRYLKKKYKIKINEKALEAMYNN